MLVFGGGNAKQDQFFSSVSILDTLTWQWTTPRLQVPTTLGKLIHPSDIKVLNMSLHPHAVSSTSAGNMLRMLAASCVRMRWSTL